MSKEQKFSISEMSQEDLELFDYLLADEGVERNQETTISAQAQEGSSPLSFAQEQMWLANQLAPESSAYNIPLALRLRGLLDKEALEKSFSEIVQRHTILQSIFTVVDGRVQQVVHPSSAITWRVVDLRDQPEAMREAQTLKLIQSEAEHLFNLAQGPLLRVTLVHLDAEEYVLMLVLHHIIADRWSLEVFMQEMSLLYPAILQVTSSPLKPLSIQYTDYSAWQRASWESESNRAEREYWLQQLANAPFVLELPTTYKRPAVQAFRGATCAFNIARETLQALRSLSQQESTTLFMVLLGAFQTLLLRYTNQDDILVGSPIANRDLPEIEPLIGVFINTLILRTNLSGNPTFQELLGRVKDTAAGAYQHQHVPFDYLVKQLDHTRDISRNPLVQVLFVYHSTSLQTLTLPGLEIQPLALNTHTAKFDLTLDIEDNREDLNGLIEYNADLYDQSFIVRFIQCFQILLQGIVNDPGQRILELPVLNEATTSQQTQYQEPGLQNQDAQPENPALDLAVDSGEEYQQLIYGLNRTDCTFPEQSTITQLFEETVECFPSRVALKFGSMQLTYTELNCRVNSLARVLRGQGVQPDTLVGIYVERSLEMVVGMLAILKAGAAYLPLDPHYPPARLKYILEDSQVQIVCTQAQLASDLSACNDLVLLDDGALYRGTDTNLLPLHHARSLAYVIYTSGTTGKPKGVMVEHQQVVRLLRNDKFQFDFDEHDVWTMFHSFCFDFSVWEMYGALLNGGQLIVIPQSMTLDIPAYREVLKNERVTVLNQTPGAFAQLCEEEKKRSTHDLALRYVIFGGEALKPGRLKQWQQFYPATKLINMYGITETTVHVTYKELTQADLQVEASNIGSAIPTTFVYILNSSLKPVPRGVIGEIFVGGKGVARGYLYNPDLTQQKFIANPFIPGERIYRTGDLGRWTDSGEIEYIGRSDQQVKIHGFRIEPGEIEAHIRAFQGVADTIVLPIEDAQGDLALCGYVVLEPSPDPHAFISTLKAYLKQHLPAHMLPAFLVPMNELPLTEHGKLDTTALPDPRQYTDPEELYMPPRNQLEQALVQIWAEVLKLPEERIGIQSRFFDLGGNSFNVLELHTQVQMIFATQISVLNYFQYPTIASFLEYMENMSDPQAEVSRISRAEEYRETADAYSVMDELTRLAEEN